MSNPTTPEAPGDRPRPEFRTAHHVVGASQADTTVLLDVERGRYYTLNEVAGRIWELLGQGASIPAIVERLGEEYDVPMATLVADTGDLIRRLLKARLIETEAR